MLAVKKPDRQSLVFHLVSVPPCNMKSLFIACDTFFNEKRKKESSSFYFPKFRLVISRINKCVFSVCKYFWSVYRVMCAIFIYGHCERGSNQKSMSPIANIEIAITIPILTKNCDPDPDRHFKNDRRSRSRS